MATVNHIDSGVLRHRVRIERLAPVTDSAGQVQQNPETGEVLTQWITLGECWARIRPVSGREFVQSQAIQAEITAQITVRAGLGIRAKDRALHLKKGVTPPIYDIHAALPDPDSGLEYETLVVSNGVNQG